MSRSFESFTPTAMTQEIPRTMRAAAIDKFGGEDAIPVLDLPVPEIGSDEILLRVETAGVGAWDPLERAGAFAGMFRTLNKADAKFPLVLGSEGAGVVAAVGDQVKNFRVGDRVYAAHFLNPKGGFYAEYAAAKVSDTSLIPGGLSSEQAGAMAGDAITALRGLSDTLQLGAGESILILGASGGLGHLAVQLAKRMGARVLAVASGPDGAALAGRLGADVSVDGRAGDVSQVARKFAPEGLDAALLTVGGEAAEQVLATVRVGGRAAAPHGVEPQPKTSDGVKLSFYDGNPDADIIARLNRLIEAGPFHVEVARSFPLEEAAEAHRALERHFLGKLAIRVSGD